MPTVHSDQLNASGFQEALLPRLAPGETEITHTPDAGIEESWLKRQRYRLSKAKKKQEKKSGGSGWQTQRWKQGLLERASISIARGNYKMLRNNRTLPAG